MLVDSNEFVSERMSEFDLIGRFLTMVLLLSFKIKTNTDFVSRKSEPTVSVILTNLRFSKHPQNEVLLFRYDRT